MTDPAISVLLPVRDAGPWLRHALEDLSAQRGPAFEVVAVEDGSQDGSAALLQEWCRRDRRFRVLDGAGRGPAAALNRALEASRAGFLAHMEADDRNVPCRLARLAVALEQHPDWDGVVSRAGLLGHVTHGMRDYVDWQNSLETPEELARARFVEIPALHQTGLYRRAVLEDLGGWREPPQWPLDIDFWMRFLGAGHRAGRIPEVLYLWRQHPRQSTRTSPRHRLEALRRCKTRFFAAGPARDRAVDLISVGRTLVDWSADLMEEGVADLVPREWDGRGGLPPARAGALRLFCYGKRQVRERIRAQAGFRPDDDWFAA